jgi:hypothetical protein
MSTDNPLFQTLLKSYGELAGFEVQNEVEALEFESDGLNIRVFVDPRQSTRVLVDVVCGSLDEALDSRGEADIAMLLHRMNSAAMLEHDWVITVDPARTVSLHHTSDMAQTTAAVLGHLMSEAAERGQALQHMLDTLQQAPISVESGQASHVDWPLHSMLRG